MLRSPVGRRSYRPHLLVLEDRLAPAVTLSISDPLPFPEPDTGSADAIFLVTRSGELGPAVQIDYTTQDGGGPNGAKAGIDYVATSGTLRFEPNQTVATIAVPVLGNNRFQPDRTFTVALADPELLSAEFAPQQSFAAGVAPHTIRVADFNGDGKPDVVVANEGVGYMSVLVNTTSPGSSTPSFAPRQVFTTASSNSGVAVGDFDADGRPDLAASERSYQGGMVAVFLNRTTPGSIDLSFGPLTRFSTSGFATEVAAADFNADGRDDLAVANDDMNRVAVLLSQTPPGGNPSFRPATVFATGTHPISVAAVDLNADGRPDLALPYTDFGGYVSVLLNTTAAGSMTPYFASRQTFTTGSGPGKEGVGDLNGDGMPDLVVPSPNLGTLAVLLNTTPAGSGPASFAGQQTFAAGAWPWSVAAGDFNGDGKPELAVANGSPANAVSVLVNQTPAGSGTVGFAPRQAFATASGAQAPAVGDFNLDGKPDLAVSCLNGGSVSVLLNAAPAIEVVGSPATGTIRDNDAPATIAIAAGSSPQSTAVATSFAVPLAIEVRNADGSLVQGVSVTFAAPAASPSGAFAGQTSITVETDAAGRAAASPFTANTKAGAYRVSAQASGGSEPSADFDLTNTPLAASRFGLTAQPARVAAGAPVAVTVAALDPYDNVATDYRGTVRFVSTDPAATLPPDYAFTPGDQGVHTFSGVILRTPGLRYVFAFDAADPRLTGLAAVLVVTPQPVAADVADPFGPGAAGRAAFAGASASLAPRAPVRTTADGGDADRDDAPARRRPARPAATLPLLEETLRRQKVKLGPDHPETLRTMNLLGGAHREAGRLRDALAMLEEALGLSKAKLGPDHPRTLVLMNNLARTYLSDGKQVQAEALLTEALANCRKKHPADSPELATTLVNLGYCFLQQDQFAAAEPHPRECLAIREKKQPEHWSRFNTQCLLGAALAGQKNYTQAELVLLSGYEGLKAREKNLPASARPNLAKTLERVIRLYEAWGQPEKADTWRAQRDQTPGPPK